MEQRYQNRTRSGVPVRILANGLLENLPEALHSGVGRYVSDRKGPQGTLHAAGETDRLGVESLVARAAEGQSANGLSQCQG